MMKLLKTKIYNSIFELLIILFIQPIDIEYNLAKETMIIIGIPLLYPS